VAVSGPVFGFSESASNRMIDIEDLDDDELERMRKRFGELSSTSPRFGDEEAEQEQIRGESEASSAQSRGRPLSRRA
jgi:hypothetical protein